MEMLKRYLIPHEGNGYKPHLLREFSVIFLALIIVFLLPFFAFIYSGLITHDFFLSAIFPPALVGFANDARVSESAPVLAVNPLLEKAAQMKADDMASKSYFAHVSPEGFEPWHWLEQAGYNFSAAGENLAIDFSDSKDVSEAWLNSPAHRANILNKKFKEIGIATAKGVFRGRETVFVVQFFGLPAEKSASSATAEIAGANREDGQETEKNDLFIAVKGAEIAEKIRGNSAGSDAVSAGQTAGARILETASSPRTLLLYSYLFLSFLILMSLAFMICMEAARKHARHLVYGFFLLALAAGAFYASVLFIPSGAVLII